MTKLADLVGEAAAAEILSQADVELRALLERHRRAVSTAVENPLEQSGVQWSGDVAAPEHDQQEQHRRREPDPRR